MSPPWHLQGSPRFSFTGLGDTQPEGRGLSVQGGEGGWQVWTLVQEPMDAGEDGQLHQTSALLPVLGKEGAAAGWEDPAVSWGGILFSLLVLSYTCHRACTILGRGVEN